MWQIGTGVGLRVATVAKDVWQIGTGVGLRVATAAKDVEDVRMRFGAAKDVVGTGADAIL